ncbi:hypothetical protein M670_02557 [Schinkia azotoformans MEV2011]|uniref:Uncharacterized protein n=1 Tax=Schinkia azotoformans MEV2011 TaxID=1348973 RepID=A0A072NKE3_SCHAZ|nr:hypothetical protein M670_04986 [Schinkia azotoformans MEV2011]KEF38139.1 hypothetical protein M670_02557 [Schinkia azotoformans MEV2011]
MGSISYEGWIQGKVRRRDPRRSHRLHEVVNLMQVRDGQAETMDGEKSEQGIVVNKLIGKVAKVSDLVPSY